MNDDAWAPFGYTKQWDQKDKYEVHRTLYSGETPVRLGIVGLGGVAQGKHLPAIYRLQLTGYPIRVAAIAEIKADMGTKAGELLDCSVYTDYRLMYDNEELDAVQVLVPPYPPRDEIIRHAFEAGIPVFAEKPLLSGKLTELRDRLSIAKELCDEADRKNLVFAMGFSKRFSPPYANARKLVQEGRIGRVSMVAAKMCQGWAAPNLLENQVCHIIDALRFCVGNITSVFATGTNVYQIDAYPLHSLSATLQLENGIIGAFYVNSSNPSLKPWERLEIFGEGKWLCVEDGSQLILHDSDEGPSKIWQAIWPTTLVLDEEFSGFVGEIVDFLDAVRGKHKPTSTGWDGYRALEVAYALHLSNQEDRKITLPVE